MTRCEPPPRRLRKPAGIVRREDFLRVQSRGRRFQSELVTLLVDKREQGEARVGFTVSRKVGNAVVRNRVRRRLREIVRLHPSALGPLDHVLVAKPRAALASYAELERAVLPLLEQARRRA